MVKKFSSGAKAKEEDCNITQTCRLQDHCSKELLRLKNAIRHGGQAATMNNRSY